MPHQVMFRDIDAFGHVNNAIYFSYFEHARTELWLGLIGGSSANDINFVVVHAECDFRHQVRMEPIEICVRFGELRTTSIEFLSEIRRGGEVAATGKVVVVMYDWEKQCKVPISDDLRRRVASLQEV